MEDQSTTNGQLWLLVEMESYGGKTNYAVVDSDEVIGQPSKDNMHTGKTVKIRKGKITVPATVVIISDDREFLETELKQLKKMSIANLTPSVNNQQNFDEQKASKRRRTINDNGTSQFYHQQQHIQWQLNSSQSACVPKERIIIPSTASVCQQTFIAPPMTFDQQTQTDPKQLNDEPSGLAICQFAAQLNQILANQEIHAEKEKQFFDETLANQKVVYDLIDEFRVLKNEIYEMGSKLAKLASINEKQQTMYIMQSGQDNSIDKLHSNTTVDNYNLDSSGGVVMNENHEVAKDEIIISFENDVSNQSISNQSGSRISLGEINNAYFSSVSEFNYSKHQRKSLNSSTPHSIKTFNDISVSNTSLNGSVASQSNHSIAEGIIQEWSKDDTKSDTDDEFVTIGSNKTQVPKHVMRSINWNSHTAATRKLLMSLFKRDILATHSLTGKPSPAFIDRKKPVKNQLDHKIVSDIIQIVTKCCGVSEGNVRNAITTKCADENKMDRQRMGKKNISNVTDDGNKENHKN